MKVGFTKRFCRRKKSKISRLKVRRLTDGLANVEPVRAIDLYVSFAVRNNMVGDGNNMQKSNRSRKRWNTLLTDAERATWKVRAEAENQQM